MSCRTELSVERSACSASTTARGAGLLAGEAGEAHQGRARLALANAGSDHLPHVGQVARDRRRRGHRRAHQVRPAALALAALEVAVAGRGAALAGLELVRVHAEAHRAAGLAPVE